MDSELAIYTLLVKIIKNRTKNRFCRENIVISISHDLKSLQFRFANDNHDRTVCSSYPVKLRYDIIDRNDVSRFLSPVE